jgi:hypothetical protein
MAAMRRAGAIGCAAAQHTLDPSSRGSNDVVVQPKSLQGIFGLKADDEGTCWDRRFADSPLEGNGFELPVPHVGLGKPIEPLRRLEESSFTAA